jgi:hypothetical protein
MEGSHTMKNFTLSLLSLALVSALGSSAFADVRDSVESGISKQESAKVHAPVKNEKNSGGLTPAAPSSNLNSVTSNAQQTSNVEKGALRKRKSRGAFKPAPKH